MLDQLIVLNYLSRSCRSGISQQEYSLEGIAALIPLVDEIIEARASRGSGARNGHEPSRTLNVIVQVAQRGPEEVLRDSKMSTRAACSAARC